MKHNTDSLSDNYNILIGLANNNREMMQFKAYSMMVSDLLKNERKYNIYPQLGKYSKIFRYVTNCQ